MSRVSVAEAAERLGVSKQFVRCGLRTGQLPIGTALQMSSVYTYYISEEKLNEYMGTAIPNQQKGTENEKGRNYRN